MALPRCWLDAGSVMLLDRLTERAALGQLLEAARADRSAVLVVHGEAGVGKTALLEDAVASAAGMRIARVAGIESGMELAYAAWQQLCAPMLEAWSGCRIRSVRRWAWFSGFGQVRHRTGFWWDWRR